jgi:hypothetical protein
VTAGADGSSAARSCWASWPPLRSPRCSNARLQSASAASRELVASALLTLGEDPELSLALAERAARIDANAQAEDALRQGLLASRAQATLSGHAQQVTHLALSMPDEPTSWDMRSANLTMRRSTDRIATTQSRRLSSLRSKLSAADLSRTLDRPRNDVAHHVRTDGIPQHFLPWRRSFERLASRSPATSRIVSYHAPGS